MSRSIKRAQLLFFASIVMLVAPVIGLERNETVTDDFDTGTANFWQWFPGNGYVGEDSTTFWHLSMHGDPPPFGIEAVRPPMEENGGGFLEIVPFSDSPAQIISNVFDLLPGATVQMTYWNMVPFPILERNTVLNLYIEFLNITQLDESTEPPLKTVQVFKAPFPTDPSPGWTTVTIDLSITEPSKVQLRIDGIRKNLTTTGLAVSKVSIQNGLNETTTTTTSTTMSTTTPTESSTPTPTKYAVDKTTSTKATSTTSTTITTTTMTTGHAPTTTPPTESSTMDSTVESSTGSESETELITFSPSTGTSPIATNGPAPPMNTASSTSTDPITTTLSSSSSSIMASTTTTSTVSSTSPINTNPTVSPSSVTMSPTVSTSSVTTGPTVPVSSVTMGPTAPTSSGTKGPSTVFTSPTPSTSKSSTDPSVTSNVASTVTPWPTTQEPGMSTNQLRDVLIGVGFSILLFFLFCLLFTLCYRRHRRRAYLIENRQLETGIIRILEPSDQIPYAIHKNECDSSSISSSTGSGCPLSPNPPVQLSVRDLLPHFLRSQSKDSSKITQ